MTVKGFEKREFRDIEAFDANTAIIIAVDSPAYILKTTDGGDTWKVVYENRTRGMFLDAMDFSDYANGLVVGDPINNKIFLAYTTDNGSTWKELTSDTERPKADSGEAFCSQRYESPFIPRWQLLYRQWRIKIEIDYEL